MSTETIAPVLRHVFLTPAQMADRELVAAFASDPHVRIVERQLIPSA